MIQSRNTIAIIVNYEEVEIYDQESLNLRLNAVLYDPSKITSTQGEYSFSFNLPITSKNSRIFGFANVLPKLNKFNKRYDTIIICDGEEIFNGKLMISSIDKENFKVNIFQVKLNTVEDIFGESTMNEATWIEDFDGAEDINTFNNDANSKVIFPLVSYGAFQKLPEQSISSESATVNVYTPVTQIDWTNQWYLESFSASPQLSETVKKMFAYKGFNVSGDIFSDPDFNKLYMSTNLNDNQDPQYPYGSDLGKLDITVQWSNYINLNTDKDRRETPIAYNLKYPKEVLNLNGPVTNFPEVGIYDVLTSQNTKVDVNKNKGLMLRNNNGIIAIPADGLYTIEFDAWCYMDEENPKSVVEQYYNHRPSGESILETRTVAKDLTCANYPIEIQLVRNSNFDEELIYNSYYPHQKCREGWYTSGTYNMGYHAKDLELHVYDPLANPNFICGLESGVERHISVIKNGSSWDNTVTETNNSRYECDGYWGVKSSNMGRPGETITWAKTDYNKNTYVSPNNFCNIQDATATRGKVFAVVELKKNDILSLKVLTKLFTLPSSDSGERDYNVEIYVDLKIEAYTPAGRELTVDMNNPDLSYWRDSKFPVKLNVNNFFNSQTKISDFINNVIKEFNLSYQQDGSNVYLNKQKKNFNLLNTPVSIDDRVNSDDAEIEPIDFPKSIQVNYSINTYERGFYDSVPYDKLETSDWKDYGNYGSEEIELLPFDDLSKETLSLQTSYTWLSPWTYYQRIGDGYGWQGGPKVTKGDYEYEQINLELPTIALDSNMLGNYEDLMKKDGKNLKLRYWLRTTPSQYFIFIGNDKVNFLIPAIKDNNLVLNYKNEENSLLNKYFNINPDVSSNVVKIKCYLKPFEYELLKNAANIQFDSDEYIVSEISGFDPLGYNLTELTLIKR